MTRDFAKSANNGYRGSSQIPTWVWFLTGFVSGFFVAFLIYLDEFVPGDPQAHLDKELPEVRITGEPIEEMELDFYDIFPNAEVPIVEEFKADGTKVRVTEPAAYLLQTGSFQKKEDADKLRAKLILLGLDAFSRQVEVQGEKWHRVLVGPMDSTDQLGRTRQLLADAQIESMAIKVKP